MPDDVQVNETGEGGKLPVLEVFGIKLAVSNPRLATLLTMDAREALTTDVRRLYPPASDAEAAEIADEAVEVDGTDRDPARRAEFERLAREAALTLGFQATGDGVWLSPTGASVVTRCVEVPVSFAAATRIVAEVARRRLSLGGEDATGLLIVEGQETAGVFKVAVRQGQLHDVMRVVAFDNLLELRRLAEFGTIDHTQAVVLLVPMANIDVGEILSIMRVSAVDEFPEALG